MRRTSAHLQIACALLTLACGRDVLALEPADIAVMYNNRSQQSLQIARHYMTARKIPLNQLIPISCSPSESITEEDYRKLVAPQVVRALTDRKLLPDEKGLGGIKCLVTTYDVPLRILSRQSNPSEKDEVTAHQKRLEALATVLEAQAAAFERLAPVPATRPATAPATRAATAPGTRPAVSTPVTWQQAAANAGNAAIAAGQRVERLAPAERTVALAQFVTLQEKVSGVVGVLNSVRVPAGVPDTDPSRKHLADLSAKLRDLQAQYQALGKKLDDPPSRRRMITTRTEAEGLLGEARAIEELLTYLKPDQTESCFDNELALVLADQAYPRRTWVVNPKNIEAWPSMQRMPAAQIPRTLMVARLDGSTAAKAQQLVETAIKVEAKGLEGKMYLDARGLRGTDGYAAFDADIRRAADWLKQHATIDLVLDDNEELLQAKDCPDAALYCGWYSLRHYKESCQWVPGGVGYHVASHEMITLHGPSEMGWVVNLLNRGIVGTMGTTSEPYLHSFPKPSLFFPLLLSGQFTQGEVWQLTSPMLSWQVGFVGDPLYNPYKAKPRVKAEDLKEHTVLKNAFEVLAK